MLHYEERHEDVDILCPLPLLNRDILDHRRRTADAGVIHYQIETTEFLDGFLDGSDHRRLVGHVHLLGDGLDDQVRLAHGFFEVDRGIDAIENGRGRFVQPVGLLEYPSLDEYDLT